MVFRLVVLPMIPFALASSIFMFLLWVFLFLFPPRADPGFRAPDWSHLVTNRSSVAPADRKRRRKGGPSTDQEDLWVRFLVGAGSSHTKDVKNG